MRFLLGGYTAASGGAATGIGVLSAGAADDALAGGSLGFGGDVVRTDGSPSWITWHPSLDVVYAALEDAQAVQAYRRTGETSFVPLGAPVHGGEALCHVAVAPDGGSLVASCWGDGRVVRMTLDAAGRPGTPVVAVAAVDPYGPDAVPAEASAADVIDLAAASRALREAAGAEYAHLVPDHDSPAQPLPIPESGRRSEPRPSRAHEARHLPDGSIATTDAGLDLVRFWRDAGDGLRLVQEVVLPKGSGPRHTVRHPSGHLYVVTEQSHEVFVLAFDASAGARPSWRIVSGTQLGAGILDTDSAAEIALSHDAGFVYAGVRGIDAIATLRVRGNGSTLEPVALVEAGVHWPRHHLVERDTLLVAGQRSDDVASLGLDVRTGVPGRVRHRTAAPSPTCILPLR